MTSQERVKALKDAGLPDSVVAAILNVEPATIVAVQEDPAGEPPETIGGGAGGGSVPDWTQRVNRDAGDFFSGPVEPLTPGVDTTVSVLLNAGTSQAAVDLHTPPEDDSQYTVAYIDGGSAEDVTANFLIVVPAGYTYRVYANPGGEVINVDEVPHA